MKTKRCSKCRELKALTCFHKQGKGVRSQCIVCALERRRELAGDRRATKPTVTSKTCVRCGCEKPIEQFSWRNGGKYRKSRCRICEAARSKEWRTKNPEKQQALNRKNGLRIHHGISLEVYNKMLADQDGCCAICGDEPTNPNRPLAVDHDHSTGQTRKLLCDRCNPGLGYFQDSIKRLQSAIRYLKGVKKQND